MNRANGFIGGVALLVLPAIVLLAAGSSAALQAGERYLERAAAARSPREEALGAVLEAMELIAADATPEAQSRHDPLWRRRPRGVEIEEAVPRGRCVPGQQCFSRYAYVNVNAAPLHLLETVVAARLPPDRPAEPVLATLRSVRSQGELLSPAGLRLALGEHHEALAPVITAHALVNVNTAPPPVVEAVLAAEAPAVDTQRALRRILEARDRGEILRDGLPGLLGVGPDARVLSFLGVRSFTLRLLIERGGRRFEAVLARVPEAAGGDGLQLLRFAEVAP